MSPPKENPAPSTESQRGGPLSESAVYWRPAETPGLELMRATFRRQNFAPHFHPCYAFGVIESGAMAFDYLGRSHVAAAGEINLVVPGEVHDGRAANGPGWTYRMFYLDPAHLTRAAGEMAGRAQGAPYFPTGVLKDRKAAEALARLHVFFSRPGPFRLERESRLLCVLAGLIRRHATAAPPDAKVGREPGAVKRARELLEARYRDNPSLEELSLAAGLSRYHLLRVFKEQTGLTPHAYLDLARLGRARTLLDQGQGIAQAAAAAGYSDQSHLNRRFKRIFGITPGQYRNSVQDR